MIDFPNAKINLGLRVLDKRPDGYHNISTVIYPVYELYDVLEIIPSDKFIFECAGPYSKGLAEDNLCVKAYNLLNAKYGLAPVHIYLYKNIPVGAGLGGGSADAAFTLKLINVIFFLNLSDEQLEKFALRLGSDCPFFIRNKPCYAAGRGEILTNVSVDLNKYSIKIKMPDVAINTVWAYKQLEARRAERSAGKHLDDDVLQAVSLSIDRWKTNLHNDFEEVVFEQHPQIHYLKEEFYAQGAIYASLSGSGAALFAVGHKN